MKKYHLDAKGAETEIEKVEVIDQKFINSGFGKVKKSLRLRAAHAITGKSGPDYSQTEGEIEDIRTLVTFYRQAEAEEFLKTGFDLLSPADKLQWLRQAVESPEFGFPNSDMIRILSGRGGVAFSALLRTYFDSDPALKTYARLVVNRIFTEYKSDLMTPSNVEQYMKDLAVIFEIPQPYLIAEERLKETSTTLTSFMFNLGGNVYVFNYFKNGKLKHTLIDTGERRYQTSLLKLFADNNIEPGNIERILLTHHHVDHSGLIDIVCLASGATVLMHPEFQEDTIDLTLPKFGKYIKKLPEVRTCGTRTIGDLAFPVLDSSLDIGEGARLEILGLPDGDQVTHTRDQLFFFYTPRNSPDTFRRIGPSLRPTDEIIFSGDLWLMHPPGFFERTSRHFKVYDLINERRRIMDFRPQNRSQKDALKMGFDLVRVKPGHGPEFLGSKIVSTLLARRDILVKLRFDENTTKKVLDDPGLALAITGLKEAAYETFVKEMTRWLNPTEKGGLGYDSQDVAKYLLQIYIEQSGGGELAGQDRIERRADLKDKLLALSSDLRQTENMRLTAGSTYSSIDKLTPDQC